MSDSSRGLGWWQASDGKWYPPQPVAPPVGPPPVAPKAGLSGCAKAAIIGGIVALVCVVGVGAVLLIAVGRGVDNLSERVVGDEGRPDSLPEGEDGYPGMLEQDRVAGADGTVKLAGYTTTATGWARTTADNGQAIICGDVIVQSEERQADTADPDDVLEVVGVQNWTLLTPDGTEGSLSPETSDFDALANFAQGRLGGTSEGKVCFLDSQESGRHVVTWQPRLFNAARSVWLVEL
jgi:hypothetical protein